MIIASNINCKNYKTEILNNYQIYSYECPKCQSRHYWVRHATYGRNVVLVENFVFVEMKMNILRLKCNSCKSTHAILPSDIIPYCIYSLACIFKLITEHYLEKNSVICIAKKYKISFHLICHFLKLFNSFINECISTLRLLEIIKCASIPTPKEVLKLIVDNFENMKTDTKGGI